MHRNNRMLPALVLVMVVSVLISQPVVAQEVPTETPTSEATATLVPTQTATPTLTETALPTLPPTPLPTETPTESYTPSLEPTNASTATATGEATNPTATPTATFTPEPPLALILNETFDGTLSPLWNIGPSWVLTPSENGQALSATNLDTSVSLTVDNLNDVVVQLRTQFTGGLLRLNLRESAAGTYTLTLDTAGQLKLYRASVEIASALVAPMGANWRIIRLSTIGGIIRVAVDGADMLAIYDQSPLPPGGFSLAPIGFGQATFLLDDVSFWVPDVSNPQATPTTGATASLAPSATIPLTETATSLPTETQLPTATATLEAEPPLNLLMTDNFDTGALYFWTVGEGWTLTPNNTGLAMQAVATAAPLSFVHSTLTDVAVEARVKQTNSAVRLSLRESATGAYVLTIAPDGQVTLAGGTEVLATSQLTDWTADTWRTIRLSAVGSVLRVAIDNVPLMAIRDENPLPMGGFAFSGSAEASATLLIDDVSLWIAGELPATATPTATATNIPNMGDYLAEQIFYQDFDQGGDPLRGLLGPFWATFRAAADNIALYIDADNIPSKVTDAELSDVSLMSRVRLQTGNVNLHVRQQVDSGYVATLSATGEVALLRNGVVMEQVAVSDYVPGTWNDLKVTAIDAIIRIAVNGNELITYSDPEPLVAGRGQISAGNLNRTYALVDNISLSRLSSPNQAASVMGPMSSTTDEAEGAAFREDSMSIESATSMSMMSLSNGVAIPPDEIWAAPGDLGYFYQIERNNQVQTIWNIDQSTGLSGSSLQSRISPEGTRILLDCSGNDLINYICVMNVDDRSWYRVEGTERVSSFDWSPDGSRIVFSREEADGTSGILRPQLFTIDADGTDLKYEFISGKYPRWVKQGQNDILIYITGDATNFYVESRLASGGASSTLVVVSISDLSGGFGNESFDVQVDSNDHLKLVYSRLFSLGFDSRIQNSQGQLLEIFTLGLRVHDFTTGVIRDHYAGSFTVVLDGQYVVGYRAFTTDYRHPVFSPDGQRVAYTPFSGQWWSLASESMELMWRVSSIAAFNGPSTQADTELQVGPTSTFYLGLGMPGADWIKPVPQPALPIEGMIVYSAEDANGISQIYGMVGNTGVIQQLTATTTDATSPALSPDGRTLAFVVNDAVHTKDISAGISSPINPIPNTGSSREPNWTGDNKILMIANNQLIRVSPNGNDLEVLMLDPTAMSDLSLSRLGDKLVYTQATDNNGSDIYILDMIQAGATPQPVTNDGSSGVKNLQPALSPDGSRIAFSSRLVGASDADIWVKVGFGQNTSASRVSNAKTDDGYPAWSPSGFQLAYTSSQTQVLSISPRLVFMNRTITGFNFAKTVQLPGQEQAYSVEWDRSSESVCNAVITATTSAKVRRGPGTIVINLPDGTQVTVDEVPPSLPNGTQIEVLGKYDNQNQGEPEQGVWFEIRFAGQTAQPPLWTKADLVTLSFPCTEANIPTKTARGETPGSVDEPDSDPNLQAVCDILLTENSADVFRLPLSTNSPGQELIVTVNATATIRLGAKFTNQSEVWYRVLWYKGADNLYYERVGWINEADLDTAQLSTLCSGLASFNRIASDGRIALDIRIEKLISDGNAPQRDLNTDVQFGLTVTNNEAISVTGLVAYDPLPSGLAFVSTSQSAVYNSDVNSPTYGLWSLAALDPSLSQSLSITARVQRPTANASITPSEVFTDNYKNVARLSIGFEASESKHLTVVEDYRESAVQIVPPICQIIPDESVLTFRAPIRGNPRADAIAALGTPILIDAYAIDPIAAVTWFHIIPDQPSVSFINNWIEVNSVRPSVSAVASSSLDISEELLSFCKSRIPNKSSEFGEHLTSSTAAATPWTAPSLFSTFPIGFADVCAGDVPWILGLGVSNPSITKPGVTEDELVEIRRRYGPPYYHIGVDIFAPAGSSVYSVSNNGIVVGIGISKTRLGEVGYITERIEPSSSSWGASGVQEGPGYSVIVRYGHLYVLYGHLQAIPDDIYVGSLIDAGDLIGYLGTFPGSNSHLHIEVRSYGYSTIGRAVGQSNGLELDSNGSNNPYGILYFSGPYQARDMYDVIQFFQSDVVADPSGTNDTVNGLGLDIEVTDAPTSLDFDTEVMGSAPISTGACNIRYYVHSNVYATATTSGYWGFVYLQSILQVPSDPPGIVTQP